MTPTSAQRNLELGPVQPLLPPPAIMAPFLYMARTKTKVAAARTQLYPKTGLYSKHEIEKR